MLKKTGKNNREKKGTAYDNLPSLRQFVTGKKDKNIAEIEKVATEWLKTSAQNKLSYEVDWLGVPVIQTPQDLILLQELVFKLKPDVIIETGIAHGGSLIFYASILELLGKGKVIGVDIEIREHNRKVVEAHPLFKRITMIEADSVASQTLDRIRKMIPKGAKVMVALDSDHTKPHVLKELELYKEFVTLGSYFMVSDTFTSKMAELGAADAKYINNSPMEAVKEFLKNNPGFVIDKDYNKLFTSYCPDGFLKRIK